MVFYKFLWRILPGPKWLKIIECAVLIALIVVLLFAFFFPWIDNSLPYPFGNKM
jgi:hypothetical protein